MKIKKGAESSRKKGTRKINPIIVIVCEGKDTEVNYFKNFNSRYTRVDIKVAGKNSTGKNKAKATDPYNLIKLAISQNKNYDIVESDGDRIWCVFDVDINYNNNNSIQSKIKEIEEAKKLINKKENVNVAISNPCFELWYLLHYEYTTAALKSFNDVEKKLKSYISDYSKNGDFYNQLVQNIDIAIKNGVNLRKHHESLGKNLSKVKDLVESTPYTEVVDLIKYIEKLQGKN